MLPPASERFIQIPEGHGGSYATLDRMRMLIRASDPIVDRFVGNILSDPRTESLSPYALAKQIFEWLRSHMLYMPDWNDGNVVEELRTPGYLIYEIEKLGSAIGDCDDYVLGYGGIYTRLGYPFSMVAVSLHDDRQLDHVYAALTIDGQRVSVDGIVPHPFGWEVPADEVYEKVEVAV